MKIELKFMTDIKMTVKNNIRKNKSQCSKQSFLPKQISPIWIDSKKVSNKINLKKGRFILGNQLRYINNKKSRNNPVLQFKAPQSMDLNLIKEILQELEVLFLQRKNKLEILISFIVVKSLTMRFQKFRIR